MCMSCSGTATGCFVSFLHTVQVCMQSNIFSLSPSLVKLSAASEPDSSNPFVHQVDSTSKSWFHPWEADESSLSGLRASRP